MKPVSLKLAVGFLLLAASARGVVFNSQIVANLPSVTGASFSSAPSAGAQMGAFYYFSATDGPSGTTGRELWRTDGTPGGTSLVKDVCPGPADSSPNYLTAAGTNLFFFANDGIHGTALWKSDGSAAGTVMVANYSIWTSNLISVAMLPVGSWVYIGTSTLVPSGGFFGFDFDDRVYRSDGTAGGTFPLSGPGGAVTTNQAGLGGVTGSDVLFVSFDSFGDLSTPPTNTVWRFGGNGPYTAQALETRSDSIQSMVVSGTNYYFFVATNFVQIQPPFTNHYHMSRLLRHSLSVSGASISVDVSPPLQNYYSYFGQLNSENGRLVYEVFEKPSVNGSSSFDGMKAVTGAGLPVTIEPGGTDFPYIMGFTSPYFYYQLGPTRIYRSDGTSAGTLAFDFATVGMSPYNFTQTGTRFYFNDQATPNFEIAHSDLTSAGSHRIDTLPGTNTGYPQILGTLGTLAIFSTDDGFIGSEPYRTDGTTNGTFLLKDIAAGSDTTPPVEAVTSGGLYFFTLATPAAGLELWKSDGTTVGTVMVKDIYPGTNGSSISHLTDWNGLLYFSANDGTNGLELWRSDGTGAGTFMIKDGRVGPAGSNPTELTPAGSLLFFVADDGAHGPELWRTDGTSNGTYMAQDIVPGIAPSNIRGMGAANGMVFFVAGSTATSGQLWFSTGQPGGTQFLLDLGSLPDASVPRHFSYYGGRVYFTAGPSTSPYLYRTDATPGGTVVAQFGMGAELCVAGTNLFASGATSLWKSDGTPSGFVVITNNGGAPAQFTAQGSLLYYSIGEDLWTSDGTTNGAFKAADFLTGAGVANLTPFQGTLVFSADTATYGRELWGTAPGQTATLIEDLNTLSASSFAEFLGATSNRVFYIARPGGQPYWQVRAVTVQSLNPVQSPFNGTPWPVPGHIEAENFDRGGEGLAFHDTTIENEGGFYRISEGVDIQPCTDTNGGFDIFKTSPGEWLAYTIQVAATGLYEIDVRVTSSVADGGYYHFEVDGAEVASDASFNDGTPGGWITEMIPGVGLTNGIHILRLVFDTPNSAGDNGAYNSFDFILLQTNQPPAITLQSPIAGSVFSVGQSITLAVDVQDATTTTDPVVEFFIDGQSLGTDPSRPYTKSWTAAAGTHLLSAVATDSFGVSTMSTNLMFFVSNPVIPLGSRWSVNPFGTNIGTSWRSTSYNDANWASSLRTPMGFGYPSVPMTLIQSNHNSVAIPTFYFRKWFTNDFTGSNYAALTLVRDDGAVIYLNGQEVARENLPGTTIGFATPATTNVVNNTFKLSPATDVIPFPVSMLVNGGNLLAVEVHQAPTLSGDRFDAYFDLSLAAFSYTPAPLLQIHVTDQLAALQWPSGLTNWQLEQSTNLITWPPVTNTPVSDGTTSTVQLPTQTKSYFRLHNLGP